MRSRNSRASNFTLQRSGGLALLARRPLSVAFARQEGATSEDLMPAGERSQTWFPELVAALRQSWRPDPTWEA